MEDWEFKIDFEIKPIDLNDEDIKPVKLVSFDELPPMNATQRFHHHLKQRKQLYPEKENPFAFSIIQSAKLGQTNIKKMVEEYVSLYELDPNFAASFFAELDTFVDRLVLINISGSRIVKDLRTQI